MPRQTTLTENRNFVTGNQIQKTLIGTDMQIMRQIF